MGAWPVFAQQSATTIHLGWLARGQVPSSFRAFMDTLRRLGWIEGRNLIIERRLVESGEGYAQAAADLVTARPDVLFAPGGPDVAALLAKTRSIPIVFAAVSDPVALGFVQMSGISAYETDRVN